jgi:hypothetical protein
MPYIGHHFVCCKCRKPWKSWTQEWPPKVAICVLCDAVMILKDYDQVQRVAVYQGE